MSPRSSDDLCLLFCKNPCLTLQSVQLQEAADWGTETGRLTSSATSTPTAHTLNLGEQIISQSIVKTSTFFKSLFPPIFGASKADPTSGEFCTLHY